MTKNKRIRNIIFLVLMIFINAFIVSEACLPGGISAIHSNFFAGGIKDIINQNVENKPEEVPVSDIIIKADKSNDVVLGNTKKCMVELFPSNASNKAIVYSAEPKGLVNLVPDGPSLWVEALGNVGESVKIIATAHNGKKAETILNIVERLKPIKYEVDTTPVTIKNNTSSLIDINLSSNGTVKSHYRNLTTYDLDKIDYVSSNSEVAIVKHGFIKAVGVGTCNIILDNTYIIPVTVLENNEPVILPDDDIQTGLDVDHLDTYGIDFMEQGDKGAIISHTFTKDVTDKNISYRSLTPTMAVVDNHGHIYSNKKAGTAIIKATYIANDVSFEIPVEVRKVIPLEWEVSTGERTDLSQGQSFTISAIYTKPFNVMNKQIKVTSSNEKIAKVGPSGDKVRITQVGQGAVKLTVTSLANPNLTKTLDVMFTYKAAINEENESSFSMFIRKALGHFSLFLVNGIITTLAMIFLLEDKKWSNYIRSGLLSSAVGFGVAWLSEFIQIFVPKRGPLISDVLLDFSGFAFAVISVVVIFYIIKAVKNKKRKEAVNDEKTNIE